MAAAIFEEIIVQFLKLVTKYESTDSRSAVNSKQNKNNENYILAHHNQTVKTKNRKIYLKISVSLLPGFCTLVLEVMERRRERVGRGWTK